jgi:hypothetical protein
MSILEIACLWSVLQVTLLSIVGIAISFLVARRFPKLAAAATIAVTVMLIVVTLQIPVRIPSWSLVNRNQTEVAQAQLSANRTVASESEHRR